MSIKQRGGPDVAGMDDHQLLTYLLTLAGVPPFQAGERADNLLRRHLRLERVLAQSPSELLRYPGLGEGAAAFLLLVPALIRRYKSDIATGPPMLENRESLRRLLLPHFQGQETERVCVFLLDRRLRLLSAALVAQGGRAAVSCSMRRVIELAVNHRASGVVLAHNHPDGSRDFSKEDLASTGQLFQALAAVRIPLVDHFLLAGEEIFSLREYVLDRRRLGCRLPDLQGWFPPPL